MAQTPQDQATSTPTQEQATSTLYTQGKYSTLKDHCAKCGKPIVGGCPAGTLGSTCKKYLDAASCYKPVTANPADNPDYVTLVYLCDVAQANGRSRGYAVRLTGGDAGNKRAPQAAVFTPHVYGKRKYVRKAAVQAMLDLIKAGK